jgi:hypothetical protein
MRLSGSGDSRRAEAHVPVSPRRLRRGRARNVGRERAGRAGGTAGDGGVSRDAFSIARFAGLEG